jgi:glycosyltransferase involved in cell wall biosynthesis
MGLNRLSLILPVMNQEDHIAEVVESYLEIDLIEMEVILVVNGSSDRSLEICVSLSERFPDVHVIHLSEGGYGRAVKAGLKEATGDYVCYANSARTTTEDLKKAIGYAINNHGTIIKANRKLKAGLIRTIGSIFYGLECRFLFDLYYSDINGTPKIWPREFQYLMNLQRDDSLIDLEFCLICQKRNYPVLELPIFAIKRHGGKSTTTFMLGLTLILRTFIKRKQIQNNA